MTLPIATKIVWVNLILVSPLIVAFEDQLNFSWTIWKIMIGSEVEHLEKERNQFVIQAAHLGSAFRKRENVRAGKSGR